MANEDNISSNENQTDSDKSEKLNQQALGNTDFDDAVEGESNDDLLSVPKTSGTGSNPAAAAPHSLIVHENETGEKRYEIGNDENEK